MIPEKWKIRRTSKNYKILNEWNNNHPLYIEQKRSHANVISTDDESGDFFYPDREHLSAQCSIAPKDYIEISTEEFMKYCYDYSYLNLTPNYEIF